MELYSQVSLRDVEVSIVPRSAGQRVIYVHKLFERCRHQWNHIHYSIPEGILAATAESLEVMSTSGDLLHQAKKVDKGTFDV